MIAWLDRNGGFSHRLLSRIDGHTKWVLHALLLHFGLNRWFFSRQLSNATMKTIHLCRMLSAIPFFWFHHLCRCCGLWHQQTGLGTCHMLFRRWGGSSWTGIPTTAHLIINTRIAHDRRRHLKSISGILPSCTMAQAADEDVNQFMVITGGGIPRETALRFIQVFTTMKLSYGWKNSY